MAYIPSSGSVVAFQSDPTKLQVTASISGIGGASIIGLPTVQTGASSVIALIQGSVATVNAAVANQSVSGTVGAAQIGAWTHSVVGSVSAYLQSSGSSVITVWKDSSVLSVPVGSVITVSQGSIAVAIISGSVAATFTPPANQSVSGTVGAAQIGAWSASVVGSVSGYLQSSGGSVITVGQGSIAVNIISGSIAATFSPPANQSVSGTVNTLPLGTIVTSLVSTIPSSVIVGTSIFGQLPAGTAPIGSVAVLQGTNPWIETFSNSSIIAINAGSVVTIVPGSVITVWQSSSVLAVSVGSTVTVLQAPSIVGTYAEDAAHTTADKGLFSLNVRNDTLSSITSADGDYSPMAVGPTGEVLIANSPITKWVYGTTSIVSGPSVALIAAQGASIFTYVTALNIVNPSANNLYGNLSTGAGAASVLAYFTAPANGGSNMVFPNPLRSRDNTAILASISGVGSVYLSAQGFISKT